MNKNKDSFDFMGFFLKTDDINAEEKPEISENTVTSTRQSPVTSTRQSNVKGRYILLVFLLLIIIIGVAYGSWFVYEKLSTSFVSENEEQSNAATTNESQPTAGLSAQNGVPPDQVETGKEIPEQNAKVDPKVPENTEITKPDENLPESSKVISPEDRKPLLLEGKKTLFQRVLTRPSAVVYSQIPNVNTSTQTKAEDYVLIDSNKLNCELEGFSSGNDTSPERLSLVIGTVKSLTCAGKEIAIKSNMIESGFLETVDYGMVKIQYNLPDQGSLFLLWMKPKMIKTLIEFIDNSEVIPLPPGDTLG